MNQTPQLSRIEQLYRALRQAPQLAGRAFELAFSLPVPDHAPDAGRVLHYFQYAAINQGDHIELGPPTSHIVVVPEPFAVIHYATEDLPFEFDAAAFPARIEANALDPAIHQLHMEQLYDYYDSFLGWYPDIPAGIVGREFLRIWPRVVPAVLDPVYKALNPAFWGWLAAAPDATGTGGADAR